MALDAIKSGISSLGDLLGTVGDLVYTAFKDVLSNIIDGILSIPKKVGEFFDSLMDFIKGIFVPKEEDIDSALNRLKSEFGRLLVKYNLTTLASGSSAFKDISCTIMGQTVVIIRMDLAVKALGTFRPYMRGFMALLLVLFNINQFLHLIGQPSISIIGGIQAMQKNDDKGGAD